jgi:transcriptional regulator with XRE-family HTH domain
VYKNTTIGTILNRYRAKNNLSLRALAEKVGFSYSYLAKIERGEIFLIPKDTVGLIAEKLDLSPYRMMICAGHEVDIEKDVRTIDLKLSDEELKDLLQKYRIYMLFHHLSTLFSNYKISIDKILNAIRMTKERLEDIFSGEPVALDEVVTICLQFNKRFDELFQIVRVNYDVKFKGMQNDEDVALAVHSYIERNRKLFRKPYLEVASTSEIAFNTNTNHQNFDELGGTLTDDEIIYLRQCLNVYRGLKLRPTYFEER